MKQKLALLFLEIHFTVEQNLKSNLKAKKMIKILKLKKKKPKKKK